MDGQELDEATAKHLIEVKAFAEIARAVHEKTQPIFDQAEKEAAERKVLLDALQAQIVMVPKPDDATAGDPDGGASHSKASPWGSHGHLNNTALPVVRQELMHEANAVHDTFSYIQENLPDAPSPEKLIGSCAVTTAEGGTLTLNPDNNDPVRGPFLLDGRRPDDDELVRIVEGEDLPRLFVALEKAAYPFTHKAQAARNRGKNLVAAVHEARTKADRMWMVESRKSV